ncbi:MAG: hypothetical protein OIF48_03910 [Silicimonas sp.]|nr:hypothetical protein [Silicimonas sp.]
MRGANRRGPTLWQHHSHQGCRAAAIRRRSTALLPW